MLEHFRVAHRFEGVRREVVVHLYDSVASLRQAYARLSGAEDEELADAYLFALDYGYSEGIAEPTPGPLGVVMLQLDRLTVEVIAHEMTHAAMHQYFSVTAESPALPAGEVMHGASEATAYFVGAWTANAITELQRRGYEVVPG